MNTRSGRRYVRDYDRNAQVPENPTTSEDPIEKERKSFIYDFIDHLSRVPIKVSLIDLLKLDKRRREMLTAVLASVEKEEGTMGLSVLQTAEVTKELECLSI